MTPIEWFLRIKILAWTMHIEIVRQMKTSKRILEIKSKISSSHGEKNRIKDDPLFNKK
jgi:hypothetical protein